MPTWVNFKELRSKLDFEAVLKHYKVEYRRNGTQLQALCPLPGHTGAQKAPSFNVNVERNIFQCFACKAGGNILEFAALMEGVDPNDSSAFRDVATRLQETFGLGSDKTPARRPPRPDRQLEIPVENRANDPLDFELKGLDQNHPYLLDRGFMPETIGHFGLGFCNRGSLKGHIAIPVHNEKAELVGYAGRIVDDSLISPDVPKYKFPAKREREGQSLEFHKLDILYNASRLRGPLNNLVVVSGFPAVWWLHQQGIPECVALMGSVLSKPQTRIIESLVAPDGTVWLMPDGTDVGKRSAEETLRLLSPKRTVRWVKLGDDKQPTDLTKEEVLALLSFREPAAVARPIESPVVRGASESRTAIAELANSLSALRGLGITAETWNPSQLDQMAGAMSSGERSLLQFVLCLWNPSVPWACGRFDLVDAVRTWKKEDRKVLAKWISDPWWP